MKKIVLLCALAMLYAPAQTRAQTAQLINSFIATYGGNYAMSAVPPQVDSLNVRINGIATLGSWTAQIQTSPDQATWTNCGSAVTSTAGASASGGSCTPSGAAYARVVVTAGASGGSLYGVLVGNSSLITFNSGGGATFPGTNGVVCNTSTTASVNCNSAAIQSALGSYYLPLGGGTMSGSINIPYVNQGGLVWPQSGIQISVGTPNATATVWGVNFGVSDYLTPLYVTPQGVMVSNTGNASSGYLGFSSAGYQSADPTPNLGSFYAPSAGTIDVNAGGSDTHDAAIRAGSFSAPALLSTAAQTVVNCSTSGTVTFSQPEQGASYKKAVAHFAACLGTFSYTFPTAFSFAPQLLSQSITTAVITSITTTAVSGTGATTSGFADLDGY